MSLSFPPLVIEAGGVRLRPFTAQDCAATFEACNDPLTQRWLPLPRPYTIEHAIDWCTSTAERLRHEGDGLHLVVEVDNTLAGTVGLKKTHWRAATTEIGYWAAPRARGRGLITEATRLLTDWSLTTGGMRRVELRAATENIASQTVAQRAGFTREGVLRDAGFTHDGRTDLIVFSRVVADT